MNSPIIEELNSSSDTFTFYSHPDLEKDIKKYRKKKYPIDKSIEYLVNLLDTHFDSKRPEQPLSGKIDRAPSTGNLPIFKTFLSVEGLRRNQCPRIYILITPSTIILLCSDDHISNYQDSVLRATAISRAKEMIKYLELEEFV